MHAHVWMREKGEPREGVGTEAGSDQETLEARTPREKNFKDDLLTWPCQGSANKVEVTSDVGESSIRGVVRTKTYL